MTDPVCYTAIGVVALCTFHASLIPVSIHKTVSIEDNRVSIMFLARHLSVMETGVAGWSGQNLCHQQQLSLSITENASGE